MKFVASTTLKRAGAAVALSAAMLTATGCGYIYKQPTTIQYAASDGVSFSVTKDGQRMDVRNLMLISEGKGQPGRVLGTVLNLGDKPMDLALDLNVDGYQDTTITVPAGEQIRFEDDANKLIVPKVEKMPGEMITDNKGKVGSESESFNLPILDGTLDEYKQYIPNASDKSATEFTPVKAPAADSASPSPSASN